MSRRQQAGINTTCNPLFFRFEIFFSSHIFYTQIFAEIKTMAGDFIPKEQKPENRGGKRKGAGRPKGARSWKTVEKEQIRAEKVAEIQQYNEEVAKGMPLGFKRKGFTPSEVILASDIEDEFKNRVAFSAHKLLNAQMSLALGTTHLYKKVKCLSENGKDEIFKHVLVTDPTEVRQFLDDPLMTNGEDYYYISTKEPDQRAIDSLLDRLLGKASTRVVGAKGPDGEDGPIQVVVANFEAPVKPKEVETQVQDTIIDVALSEAVQPSEESYSEDVRM